VLDRALIGHEFAPRFADVERGQLQFFAKATGETNLIYFDEKVARAAGHPTLPAPPTFLFSLELLAPDPQGTLGLLGIDIGKVLHGEQRFSYFGQIYAGDRIKLSTQISDIYEKKGGALQFVVQDTIAENQNGETVGTSRIVSVVRNGLTAQ
jgi:acyl dehydratase